MSKKCLINPELEHLIYGLYMNGLSADDIAERLKTKEGFNFITKYMVRRHITKRKWREKRQEMIDINHEVYDNQMKIAKVKKTKAFGLAMDALSDDIENDYIDFKADPAGFIAEVKAHKRRRPIWWVYGPSDAESLLRIEGLIRNDGKTKIEGEVKHTINPMSEAEQSILLEMMANAKIENMKKDVLGSVDAEIIEENKEVKELPEKIEDKKNESGA